jgi:pimeloyl-ACP methyl ester carboxylesterase
MYQASGAKNSVSSGVSDMVKHMTKKAKECPLQKYAMGGHSQGTFVTIQAIAKLPGDVLPRVAAVTMFGGGPCPESVKDRCKSYCLKGDFVRKHFGLML